MEFKYLPDNYNAFTMKKGINLLIFILGIFFSILFSILLNKTIVGKIICSFISILAFEMIYIVFYILICDYHMKEYKIKFFDKYNELKDSLELKYDYLEEFTSEEYLIYIYNDKIQINNVCEHFNPITIFEMIKIQEDLENKLKDKYEYKIYFGDFYDLKMDLLKSNCIVIKAKRMH